MPYTTDQDRAPNIARVTDEPDLPQIRKELSGAINDAFDYYERNERALDVRECYWQGQHVDGRKHSTADAAAFPWEGASDTRIRTADMIIQERVMLKQAALNRMNVQVVSPQAKDRDFSGRMAALLRWYLHNEMADECDQEIELLANYEETFGAAVLGIGWLQTLSYERKTIRIEDIAQMALQAGGPELLADVGQMLFDERQSDTILGWIRQFSPLLTGREARKVLDDWRTMAEAEVAIPIIGESRPTVQALQVMQDVIFPVNTWRLQKARWIAQRELLTEPELREKAEGREGWDEDFVEAVLQKPGETFNQNLAAQAIIQRQRELGGMWSSRPDEEDALFEVWHVYARASWRGLPTIMKTIVHPSCDDYYATHGPMEYAHGEYPFVEFVREHRARSILSSRGWPELLDTPQSEIKVQRDARIDRASITTSPPLVAKNNRAGDQFVFGPGVVNAGKPGDVEAVTLGAADPTSIEVERATKMDVNEFVGRRGDGINPQTIEMKEQHTVARFLRRMQGVGTQLLQLAQQYTPPMLIGQITGVIPKPYEISRESIAGQFRLMLSFDPRFMGTDFVFGMMEGIQKYVMPLDNNAVINRDAVIKWFFSSIDPTLGDLAVTDSESAAQNEILDEMNNVSLMVSGVEPVMKLKGQNYAARLNVLQQTFQRNPNFYTGLMQTRPDFNVIVQKRIEFLTQQVQQQKNKAIGTFGTEPSPSSTGAMGGEAEMPQIGSFAQAGGAA